MYLYLSIYVCISGLILLLRPLFTLTNLFLRRSSLDATRTTSHFLVVLHSFFRYLKVSVLELFESSCTLVHIYTSWYYVYFSRCDLKSTSMITIKPGHEHFRALKNLAAYLFNTKMYWFCHIIPWDVLFLRIPTTIYYNNYNLYINYKYKNF